MKRALVLVLIAGVLAAAGVLGIRMRGEHWPAIEASDIDDPAQLDELHLDLAGLDTQTWVRSFLPEQASPGYNLVLYRRRVPMIIDMNGRIIHIWPKVRAVGRVRLGRDGSLAVIGTDNLVKEYDWDGNLTWFHQLPDKHDLPHHDLIQLANGNSLVLAHDGHTHAEYLREVDADSRVVWEWRAVDHIEAFPSWDVESNDPTHMNSIRELPPNRWHAAGDERFRPGNILVSARNLNTIFVIDKASGEVVWQFSQGLDHQHEAVLDDQGWFGDGLVLFFNNGLANLYRYRRSLVQAIEPVSGEVVWEYGSEFFFSPISGTVQLLPSGNLLISSSEGGRVFEITRGGDIVWEWVPPYLPMRVERVPFDHCPQLAALRLPEETEVRSDERQPYISLSLYRFALPDDTITREVAGRQRSLMKWHDGCRQLMIPPQARLKVGFGLDKNRLEGRSLEARFSLTVGRGSRAPKTLVDESLNEASQDLWQVRQFALGRFAYRSVTMCISTEVVSDVANPLEMVVWEEPKIISKAQHLHRKRPRHRITEQERTLRERQLEALGYIN